MSEYGERVAERIAKKPGGQAIYQRLLGALDVPANYPWARSVVVAVMDNSRYAIPLAAQGRYGRTFLTDNRRNPRSLETIMPMALGEFMEGHGLRLLFSEQPGAAPLRWTAKEAGLGVIRRNNFFWTKEHGSWVTLAAFLTDADIELLHAPPDDPCPEGCRRCQEACPAKTLGGPYAMGPDRCAAFLTAMMDPTELGEEAERSLGRWICGCDACQEACPKNKGKLSGADAEFPGLADLRLSPMDVAQMGYEEIAASLAPKFFDIGEDSLWRWKLNAIRALSNEGADAGAIYARLAREDPFEIVRRRAQKALAAA